ncbi:MAG: hypothetical protein ACUVV1_01910 [Fimbriimonadales bacterium]
MSHPLKRALENGTWMFALALVLLSAWGAGRTVCQMMTLLREQSVLSELLAQLETSTLTMERSLLGLAQADHPKVRYAGYDPQSLYRDLQGAQRVASACAEAIETRTAGKVSLETDAALMRLQAAWQQTDAALSDYLHQGQPALLSLSTLRAFSFQGQLSLAAAVEDFRRAYQIEQQTALARGLWEMLGYFVLQLVSTVLLLWLVWQRYGAPARWLRALLHQPDRAPSYEARLKETEWGELYERLHAQEQRLREAERFLRDWAMGRTPAPIQPTDAADPLARSSQWVLQRMQREDATHERAS